MDETKSVLKSKINWTVMALVLFSAVSDPMFKAYFDFIPTEWLTRLSFVAGWAIIYFRSNSQPNIPLDWRNPWKASN